MHTSFCRERDSTYSIVVKGIQGCRCEFEHNSREAKQSNASHQQKYEKVWVQVSQKGQRSHAEDQCVAFFSRNLRASVDLGLEVVSFGGLWKWVCVWAWGCVCRHRPWPRKNVVLQIYKMWLQCVVPHSDPHPTAWGNGQSKFHDLCQIGRASCRERV